MIKYGPTIEEIPNEIGGEPRFRIYCVWKDHTDDGIYTTMRGLMFERIPENVEHLFPEPDENSVWWEDQRDDKANFARI